MSNYQLTSNPNVITRLDDMASIPVAPGNADYQTYLDWVAAGNTPLPVPPPTVAQIILMFLPQLQAWMDGIAQQNGYDSALSCISYLNSSVAQWAGDAQAMLKYRDILWEWAYNQQATINAMTPEQLAGLTAEYIISQAPKASDSGWVVHASPAPSS